MSKQQAQSERWAWEWEQAQRQRHMIQEPTEYHVPWGFEEAVAVLLFNAPGKDPPTDAELRMALC